MKNIIANAFKNANKENRPALISYTVCGDNNKKISLDILNSISSYLDVVEWGVPHNCPTADGKEIQNSSYRALKNGIKLNNIFEMVKRYYGKYRSYLEAQANQIVLVPSTSQVRLGGMGGRPCPVRNKRAYSFVLRCVCVIVVAPVSICKIVLR